MKAAAAVGACSVELLDDLEAFLERCGRLAGASGSPFLNASWLRAWYVSLGGAGGRRPLLVAAREEATGRDLLLLPLVARRRAGASVVEWADAGVGDYAIPAFDRRLADPRAAGAVWREVRRALRGHDLIRLEKLPTRTLDGDDPPAAHPLLAAMPHRPCDLQGHQAVAGDDLDAWRRSLGKHARKEFERYRRVFARSPGARFERILDVATADRALRALEAGQSVRMRREGLPYRLDDPALAGVYRRALADGLADRSVVLTALFDGEAIVAVQFGIVRGARWISLRLNADLEGWAACSPGKLLLERTATHLHAEGVRWFDFGIGDYGYKSIFDVEPIPLVDAVQALSWRGGPGVVAWHLRQAVARRPALRRWIGRLRGSSPAEAI